MIRGMSPRLRHQATAVLFPWKSHRNRAKLAVMSLTDFKLRRLLTAPNLVVGDEGVHAVTMRAGLGGEVHHLLLTSGHRGPVIASVGKVPQWTFLTGAASPVRVSELGDLFLLRVELRRVGTALPLPPAHGCSWIVTPDSVSLFRWHSVLAAIHRTTGATW